MLMSDDDNIGNMREVYLRTTRADDRRRYESTIRQIDADRGPYHAEIVPGREPRWHVCVAVPNQEKILTAHLTARGFGVCLPEREYEIVSRGRKRWQRALLLPGYVLVFCWDVYRHRRRIRACPGFLDFLWQGDNEAVVPDGLIDHLLAVENAERPLFTQVERVIYRKRHRNSRKHKAEPMQVVVDRVPVYGEDIISVHAFSAFADSIDLDSEARLAAFRKAIGLES